MTLHPKWIRAKQPISKFAHRFREWWRIQAPVKQDRFAVLAPLLAVLLFFVVIAASFAYLRQEELEREEETVKRDVQYAQQGLTTQLLERQEQLMLLARNLSSRRLDKDHFKTQADALISKYPDLQQLSWIDERGLFKASTSSVNLHYRELRQAGAELQKQNLKDNYTLVRELLQPVYDQQTSSKEKTPYLELMLPLNYQTRFAGVLFAEFSVASLYRYAVPTELTSRYAVSLLDRTGQLLAGSTIPKRNPAAQLLPWNDPLHEYEVAVATVGNSLVLRGQAYRTSLDLIGSGLFWLVSVLSSMTAWMLIANWRHTKRRQHAQQALISETNFRRAMENSISTGMRAMDLQGRITYVNAAFCQMTGWPESALIGQTAPFPYWPEDDREKLLELFEEELAGRTTVGGIQVRVKRQDQSIFDARLYVSPLIDAHGAQTGWMTSITDITEPNRIREQLSASFERFTTVMDAMDASVSVAPVGNNELLFSNMRYRQWFGERKGHIKLLRLAGIHDSDHPSDQPTLDLGETPSLQTSSQSDYGSVEVFLEDLGKWLEVRLRPISWVDGRPVQMVIATDVSVRRVAQEAASAQEARAQNISRLITMGEMASTLAHELNQPLTAINNYCNGMLSRIKSKQMQESDLIGALAKTSHQAQRAGQIIQRIRSFVKRSEPNRSMANVATIVEEAIELAGIELRRRNVRLSYLLAPNLPTLRADKILIEQVLINLLKNSAESIDAALRSSAERKVELRVTTKQVENLPVIEFTVLDSGKGISPEVMDHLYQAFFSTKVDGMGMGLNLCRSIVESHQGRMHAENLYNGAEVTGCRLSFWLPLTESETDSANTDIPDGQHRISG